MKDKIIKIETDISKNSVDISQNKGDIQNLQEITGWIPTEYEINIYDITGLGKITLVGSDRKGSWSGLVTSYDVNVNHNDTIKITI